MPAYTILSLISLVLVFGLDLVLETKLFKSKKFWLYQLICFVLQFFADGYLTWRPIYVVNPGKILQIYLFTTPLENFIFGFSMLYLLVIVFETLVKTK